MALKVGVMEGVLKQLRDDVFHVARELGFDGLEIEVRGDREALRAARATSGLPISSLICSGDGLGALEAATCEAACERLQLAISDAGALNVGGILLPHFTLKNLDDRPAVQRFVESVRACTRDAELLDVVVAWENSLDAADTATVLRQIGSRYFRCYFDFANTAKRGADPADELRALLPDGLIHQVHAKNVNKQPLNAPGVNLRECLGLLQAHDYNGWIVLETPAGEDPIASARHNQQVVRDTWAALQS